MKRETDPNYMQTAGRAIDILNCFADGEPLSLTSISKRTGLSASVTFRLLYTLIKHGFVTQMAESKLYLIGDQAVLLGLAGVNERKIVKVGYDLIWEWSQQTGHSITISSLIGNQAIVVARVNTLLDERDMTRVGRGAPLHRGASQRILLAYMEQEAQNSYIESLYIENSAKDALRKDLAEIRDRGYDYTEGMLTKGVWAISLPIFSTSKKIEGSMCTGGVIGETSPEDIQERLDQLRRLQRSVQEKMNRD